MLTTQAGRTGYDDRVFEEIADAMPHMVWLADPGGAATYHNRRIREYSGLPTGVTLGGGWGRLVHPDDLAPTRDAWSHAVAAAEPFEVEYRLRRHDGAYRWFLSRADAQRDEAGRVVRWVGTCTDVDDQKGQQARFRAIIERSFDVVDLIAPDGTILYSSPAGVRLLGYPRDENVGRNGFDLIHPADRDRVRRAFEALLADTVHRARRRDGHYLWLEARATNLLHDPAVRAVVVNVGTSATGCGPGRSCGRASSGTGSCSTPTPTRCGCTTPRPSGSWRSTTPPSTGTGTPGTSSSRCG